MPIINGAEYNDALWEVAGKVLVQSFSDLLPHVTEIYLPAAPKKQIEIYKRLVAAVKQDFRQRGIAFDEANFRPASIEGPNVIRLSFVPQFA